MKFFTTIFILALFATGCAKVPSQQSYPYDLQHKMQSANHWEKLAKNVVCKQIGPYFIPPVDNKPNPAKPESITGVYIGDQDKSSFGTAFHTYLTTELFNHSIPVSSSPENSFTVDWSVQKVIHDSERKNPGPPFGILGYLGYGIGWIFGGDYYMFDSVPHMEMLVTTKIKSGDTIYSRITETLYIDDEDSANYWVLPDRTSGEVYSYIRSGSTVCRESGQLESALSTGNPDNSPLQNLIKEDKCAVTDKEYQVALVEDQGDFVVIKSMDPPYFLYVTAKESLWHGYVNPSPEVNTVASSD